MKLCRVCETEKHLDQFHKHASTKDGLRDHCIECASIKSRAYRLNNKEKYLLNARRANVKNNFGLTLEKYQEMLSGECGSCGSTDDLCIDHDHACCPGRKTCGKCIRGVLCGRCNRAEGNLLSDPERANNLEQYMLRNVNLLGALMVSDDQLIR